MTILQVCGRVNAGFRRWSVAWMAVAALLAAPAALAQGGAPTGEAGAPNDGGFLKKVNDIYGARERAVPDAQRADLILLPKLAAMDAPPSWLTPLNAALMTTTSKGWADADAWAAGDNQRAALDAFKQVTPSDTRFAFNQGYGRDAADPAVRDAGLYTEMGRPAILAAAKFNYLQGLDRLSALAQLEASRLGEAKQAADAADLMVRWVLLGRMLVDREFAAEKQWGAHAMIVGFERLRDVVRQYSQHMTDADLRAIIERIEPKNISPERVLLPQGDRLAAEQIVALGFVQRGGPKAETFGAIMARVTSAGRPLAQFGEAARWQAGAAGLATTFETIDAINASYNDWSHRWSLRHFDPLQDRPTDFSRLDESKYQVVVAAIGGVPELFRLRQRVIVEAAGSRMALGVVAFRFRNNQWPLDINAVRPKYVRQTDPDPFDPRQGDLHFFVPIRDQPRGERELPKPHVIQVGLPGKGRSEEAQRVSDETDKLVDLIAADISAMLTPILAGLSSQDRSVVTKSVDAMRELNSKGEAHAAKLPAELKDKILEELTLRTTERRGAWLAKVNGAITRAVDARGLPPRPELIVTEISDAYREAMKGGSFAGAFSAEVDDSTFVLASMGSNQTRDWARAVGEAGSDILLWPPVLSLTRDAWQREGVDPTTLTEPWLDYRPSNAAPPPPLPPGQSKPGGREPGSNPSPGRSPGRPGLPGG